MASGGADSGGGRKSTRRRPAYMLLFIDCLRRHNNAQPKFAPGSRSSSTPAAATTRTQPRARDRRASTARDRMASPKRPNRSSSDSQALMGPETARRSQRSSRASASRSASATRSAEKATVRRGGSDLDTAPRRTSQVFDQKSPSPADEQAASTVSPVALLAQYFRLPDFFARRQAAPPEAAAAGPAPQAETKPAGSPISPDSTETTQAKTPTQEQPAQQPHQAVQSPPPPELKTIEPIVTINSNPDAPDNQQTKDAPQPQPQPSPQSPPPPQQLEQQQTTTVTAQAPQTDEPPPPTTTQQAVPPVVTKQSVPATTAAQKSASNSNSQQMAATGGHTLRLPLIKGFRTSALASATKESNAPSLTQTPAAGVGASGTNQQQQQTIQPPLITSAQQQQLARVGIGVAKATGARSGGATSQPAPLTPEQQKKISIARAVAEQTPNATELLGQGFAIRMPGEHSEGNRNNNNNNNNNQNAANKTGPLEAIPSDYEHIFHATSNLADDSLPQQQAQPTQTQAPATPPPAQIVQQKGHLSPGPQREKVRTPANKPTHHHKAGKDHQKHKQQNKKGKQADRKAKIKKQK